MEWDGTMRFYFKPKIMKNVSDNHRWVEVKHKNGLTCGDAVTPMFWGIYRSIFPSPIWEPTQQWMRVYV